MRCGPSRHLILGEYTVKLGRKKGREGKGRGERKGKEGKGLTSVLPSAKVIVIVTGGTVVEFHICPLPPLPPTGIYVLTVP